MDMQAVRSVLLDEARELLVELEQNLLAIESAGADPERINALFRAAHTLKGSSGMFNLHLVVDFTHLMENLLVRVRNGEQAIDGPLVSLLLGCGDYLSRLFDEVAEGRDDSDPDPRERARLCAALNDYLGGAADSAAPAASATPASAGLQRWRISLRPEPQVLSYGLDPLAFIQYLTDKGELLSLQILDEQLPALAELDPESCYLGFVLELRTQASRESLEQALEFIAQDCAIELECLDPPPSAAQGGAPAERQAEG
ncbi:Hpt domain-containing protein [Zestomonas thermotolerans]|uniref:Hpt domain-containing protein n=1 Tax=Zestomonas thermotolerans TaxID=157784 RepID=UPI0003A989C8|nr:Hpt domain-containing protein [Pseudomonas thermotolerans]